MEENLLRAIAEREARIGVIGLGYVGLPLALGFAEAGFPVTGFDTDAAKVDRLAAGTSYIRHIPDERVCRAFASDGSTTATTDLAQVSTCDALLICVPTPLSEHREPDLRYVTGTAAAIGPHLRRGQLVILESTTYPGTTEEVLVPALEQACGLQAGRDFLAAYSPEREDPSNPDFGTAQIPKVVGGIDRASRTVAEALYSAVVCSTIPVSNCRAAEATKLLENVFRCINIALVNELKIVFDEMGIDIWEVVRAASSKPFGFMPFYPGPGLGGHCIPIDPFYLTWKAREYGMPTKFIELAGEINTAMPDYVVRRTILALNDAGKPLKDCRLLLVGLAYKKNVDDDRESPTYVLWEKFSRRGVLVDYYDPYCTVVPPTRRHAHLAGVRSRTWEEVARSAYDVAVIATAHDNVDHDALCRLAELVVDTRGVCAAAANVVSA